MTSDHHIYLQWNNHQTTLVEMFNKLLYQERLVDCTLAAEGQYMKAHKVILSACSPYFELIFSQHKENHPIIILNDVTYRELKALVDYMYQGELNVSQDQLDALMKVAKNLQIKGLSDSGGETFEHRRSNQLDVSQDSPSALDGSPVPRKRMRTRLSSRGDKSSLSHVPIESHHNSFPHESFSLSISPNVISTPVSKHTAVIPNQLPVLERTDYHILLEPAQLTRKDIVCKTEPNTEILLEPKREYTADDLNEDSVEDMTLEDDMNDLYQSQAGPSGEGLRSQDLTPWRMVSDRSADEVLMQAQEDVGDQRDSQNIQRPEDKMNSDSDVADSITSNETLICINRANETTDTPIGIRNPEETNSVSKDALCISSQQNLILRNLIQARNARLIKESRNIRIHLQRCNDIIGAGPSSAKEQIMMSEPSSHLNSSHVDENTETNFQCAHCPKSFKGKKHLRMHLKFSNCKTELVECGQCSQKFNTKSSLIHHLQNICGKQNQNMCGYCKRQFKFEKNLHFHMKRECGKINAYKCPKCQKPYLFKKNLNCHLRNECAKREELKCEMCNKLFVSRVSLDQHVKNDCSKMKPFRCMSCWKTYKNKSSLKAHMKHDCGRTEPHKCPQCQRLFGTKDSLNKHMKHDCGRTEPHKCPQCQRLFSSKQSLDVHLKNSCGKKEKFSCPSCSKQYKYKFDLNAHMKHDCGRTEPHKCPQCQRLFSKKHTLNEHLKKRCGKK